MHCYCLDSNILCYQVTALCYDSRVVHAPKAAWTRASCRRHNQGLGTVGARWAGACCSRRDEQGVDWWDADHGLTSQDGQSTGIIRSVPGFCEIQVYKLRMHETFSKLVHLRTHHRSVTTNNVRAEAKTAGLCTTTLYSRGTTRRNRSINTK